MASSLAFGPSGRSEKLMPLGAGPSAPSGQLLAEPPAGSLFGADAPAQKQVAAEQQQQQQVQHSVHELEPLTRYSMRVIAVNALGLSRPSVALSLRTEEEGESPGGGARIRPP